MKNLDELYQECVIEAFNLIRIITHETEEEQNLRYRNNSDYNAVINHLSHMYYTFKTNKCLKREQKELEYKVKSLLGDVWL